MERIVRRLCHCVNNVKVKKWVEKQGGRRPAGRRHVFRSNRQSVNHGCEYAEDTWR
jgi:hypothetical protein